MQPFQLSRRSVLLAGIATVSTGRVVAQENITIGDTTIAIYSPEDSDFPYEIQRTPPEWRAYLDGDEAAYSILRQGKTEKPKTTDLWKEAHDGDYLCRGCDLPLYEGRWFQPLEKGWVFFHHAKPNAVLFALDGPVPQYGQAGMQLNDETAVTEIHCYRCGSHIGHHVRVADMTLHCLNGTALKLS